MAHFFAKITEHFLEISREDKITIFSQKYLDIIYQLLHTYVIYKRIPLAVLSIFDCIFAKMNIFVSTLMKCFL